MGKLFLVASFISLLMADCEPNIENDKRVIIKGEIVAPQANPIQATEVTTSVEEYVLGKTTSNTDGSFEMVAPESYDQSFLIAINVDAGNNYTSAKIFRDEDEIGRPKIYDLGAVTLRPTSNFTLTTTRNSTTSDHINVQINYLATSCVYDFNNGLQEDPSLCYEQNYISRTTNEINSNLDLQVEVIRDILLQITYQIDEEPATTIEVTPNQQNFEYEIFY